MSSSILLSSHTACIYVYINYTHSGIEVTHPDFQGRASWGIDLVQSGSARPYTDENGHGTHVTGIRIMSRLHTSVWSLHFLHLH